MKFHTCANSVLRQTRGDEIADLCVALETLTARETVRTLELARNRTTAQKSVGAPPSTLRRATNAASSSRMPSSMWGGSKLSTIWR